MRITKKFARDSCIGKQVYERAMCTAADDVEEWSTSWAAAASKAVSSFFQIRQLFFDALWIRDGINLSMIVPDPFVGLMTVSELYVDIFHRTCRKLAAAQSESAENGGSSAASTRIVKADKVTVAAPTITRSGRLSQSSYRVPATL